MTTAVSSDMRSLCTVLGPWQYRTEEGVGRNYQHFLKGYTTSTVRFSSIRKHRRSQGCTGCTCTP